jgi:serine/threonine protein kinase
MNRYDVEKIVGEGSYGRALLCRRKSDGKKCIVKQISIVKLSAREKKLTEQESTLLSKLSHPNIVTFIESFIAPNHLNIVME